VSQGSLIELFGQVHDRSVIHRLDPRVKIATLLAFVTMTTFVSDTVWLLALTVLALIPWFIARPPLAAAWPIFATGGIFIVSLFIAQVLFFVRPEGLTEEEIDYMFELGPIAIWDQAVLLALNNAFRLSIPLLISVLLILTTQPTMISRALVRLGLPHQIGFLFTTAVRFMPLAAEEATHTSSALRVRGVTGTFAIGRRSLFPVLLNTLRRARTLGIACESKAFGAGRWDAYYHDVRLRGVDWAVLGAVAVLTVGVLYARFAYGLGVGSDLFREAV
jgi:energy-coupling factor transport system permease protein